MKAPTETPQRTSVSSRREPAPGHDIFTVSTAVGTAVLVVLEVLSLKLPVHTRHTTEVVVAAGIVICGALLVWAIRRARDHDRRSQDKLDSLARKIEEEQGGVAILVRGGKGSKPVKALEKFLKGERLHVVRLSRRDVPQPRRLLEDLVSLLEQGQRLAVVRLDRRHLLDPPPGL
jgi:hypothetical protein